MTKKGHIGTGIGRPDGGMDWVVPVGPANDCFEVSVVPEAVVITVNAMFLEGIPRNKPLHLPYVFSIEECDRLIGLLFVARAAALKPHGTTDADGRS